MSWALASAMLIQRWHMARKRLPSVKSHLAEVSSPRIDDLCRKEDLFGDLWRLKMIL